jgi:CelD/BcsL family acetyltransferase involved in cellulose biosynthesis
MEVWLARLSGRLAAFQVNLVTSERVLYYYGAYDAEYRRYYPGGILHLAALEHAWARGIREYDFLSGGEPYKLEWTNASRRLRVLAAHPNTPRGALAYALFVALRWHLRTSPLLRPAADTLLRLKSNPSRLLPWRRPARVRAH